MERIVRNVDGTTNKMGEITHGVVFDIKYDGVPKKHMFYIVDIGVDDLILRYPFFKSAEPRIDWKNGWMDVIMVLGAKSSKNPLPLKVWIAKTTMATQLDITAKKQEEKPWDQLVPKQYHKFGKVFQVIAFKCFPGKRPWDHAIDLLPYVPKSMDCRVYPLLWLEVPLV